MRTGHRLTLALLLLPACVSQPTSHHDNDSGPTATCGPNLKPYKTACVPVLDDCPEDHVPVPGGGCKHIGAEECTVDGGPGIKGPPDWTCTRVGPPRRTCLRGFAKVKDGWCEPVLPTAKCPSGQMAIIGSTACQPVGDCGSGTWGSIKATADTAFVDGAYTGTDADGSMARPFQSITAALGSGKGRIAIAAGTYNEDLVVDRTIVIEGRCPALVTIKALDHVLSPTGELTLRGVTVTGVWFEGVRGTLEQVVVVEDGAQVGVSATVGANVALRDVLVEGVQGVGVYALNASVSMERCAVRDTGPLPGDWISFGVWAQWESDPESPPKKARQLLSMKDCVVSGSDNSGVLLQDAAATIERSVLTGVRGIDDGPFIPTTGGVEVSGKRASLVLRDSLVADNYNTGIILGQGELIVERSVIRDTRPRLSGDYVGDGFGVHVTSGGVPGRITLRDSLVARNHGAGLELSRAHAVIERSVIQATHAHASVAWRGAGIYSPEAAVPTSLVLRDSLVRDNHFAGVSVTGPSVTIERTVVKNTLPNALPDASSIGILANWPAVLTLRDSRVEGTRGVGLALQGAVGAVTGTVVRDSSPAPSGRTLGYGIVASVAVAAKTPALLTVKDSVVANAQGLGLAVIHSDATVERTVVRDTREEVVEGKAMGVGIYAGFYLGLGLDRTATLELRDSVVRGSAGAGLQLLTARATVSGCRIEKTAPTTEGFGDGIAAAGDASHGPVSVTVEDSLVQDSARAGLLLRDGGGSVRRTVLRRGTLPIALEAGASPDLVDNVLEENTDDRISFGQNLRCPPPPSLPPLPGI